MTIPQLLIIIVASFPAGPSQEASVWFDGDDRNTTCELVAGAEQGRQWHEEWTCFTWDPKCQTDGECEGSEEGIGGFERGADENGKPYRIIIPKRPTALFR